MSAVCWSPPGPARQTGVVMLAALVGTVLAACALPALPWEAGSSGQHTTASGTQGSRFPVEWGPHMVATATAGAARVDERVWTSLAARPLRLPALAPGAPCPVLPSRVEPPGPVRGDGPIAPVGSGRRLYGAGTLAREDGGWYYLKTLWTSRPEYQGPALIRGRQLDGPHELRFTRSAVGGHPASPPAELRFPAGKTGTNTHAWEATGWRDLPSETRVRAPGCYAFQVDGLDFTRVVVFEAVYSTRPEDYRP